MERRADHMGSRIMHLLLASDICKRLQLQGLEDMLLGSIAPDAAQDKRQAHYKTPPHAYAYNSPLDWGRFVVDHRAHLRSPFFVGYLTHLIMDDVWTMKTDFSGFEQRVKQDPDLYARYHNDLWRCNAKLITHYRLEPLKAVLERAASVPPFISFLRADEVLAYKQSALDDFDYPAENVTAPLDLFTFEEMIHYVERCKSKAYDVCRMLVLL